MKTRLQIILSVLTLVVLTMTGTSYAQEGSAQFESMELEGGTVDREKILLSPGEGDTRHISRTTSENTTTGDSITTVNAQPAAPKIKTEKQVPTPKPAVEKQSKEEDESILSFNFLYYIIEKYKLQDIIER